MNPSNTILTHTQISNKLKRIAWQIFENNMDEQKIWVAGIDARGQFIAQQLVTELQKISNFSIHQLSIQLHRNTFEPKFFSDTDFDELGNSTVVIVDDVMNSGKTIVSSFMPLLNRGVRKIELAVLASRSHRLYPIKADYVGISMATTLQEHLLFDNSNPDDLKLILE
jgi:pyrimidine operon attenuation protein/uracil phosphoribosyltransferase